MNTRWEVSAGRLVTDLQQIFGPRLRSVVAYGVDVERQPRPLATLVIVESLSQDDLEACARVAGGWSHADIATPIILPEGDFRRSLDSFPLEFADMVARHVRVYGEDPFEGVLVDVEDLRKACEKQVKSHLLHLREGYIEAHANPLAVARLVAASMPAFAALLRHVARLLGEGPLAHDEMAIAGARAAGLPETVVRQVLSLGGSGVKTVDGAVLFPAYLAAVEQLAHTVDAWTP